MSPVISLLAKPRQRDAQPYQKHGLVYFICGNPGLVNYYVTFLECLRGMLDAADEGSGGTAYDIYGRNLLGFSDDDHEPFSETNVPWDLDGQIEGIYQDVAARSVIPDDAGAEGEQGKGSRPYDFVVLMGHSVGAYISVEIMHRHMKDSESRAPHLNLRHGFLLFPTLTHIASSPSGRRVTFLTKMIPGSAERNAHRAAKLILGCIPYVCVLWIVMNVMGFTKETAEVTARWLKSRDGVRQAIYLGMSEMRTICEAAMMMLPPGAREKEMKKYRQRYPSSSSFTVGMTIGLRIIYGMRLLRGGRVGRRDIRGSWLMRGIFRMRFV
jgi:hypothetical protein